MNPDDPKLTAYALDELDPAERAEIEQLLRENPDALAEVQDTERLAAQLRRELRAEPAQPLTPEQRAEVFSAANAAVHGRNGAPSADALPVNVVSLHRRWSRPMALAASIAVLAGVTYLALNSIQKSQRVALDAAHDRAESVSPAPATATWRSQPGVILTESPASAAKPDDANWLMKLPSLATADGPQTMPTAEPANLPAAPLGNPAGARVALSPDALEEKSGHIAALDNPQSNVARSDERKMRFFHLSDEVGKDGTRLSGGQAAGEAVAPQLREPVGVAADPAKPAVSSPRPDASALNLGTVVQAGKDFDLLTAQTPETKAPDSAVALQSANPSPKAKKLLPRQSPPLPSEAPVTFAGRTTEGGTISTSTATGAGGLGGGRARESADPNGYAVYDKGVSSTTAGVPYLRGRGVEEVGDPVGVDVTVRTKRLGELRQELRQLNESSATLAKAEPSKAGLGEEDRSKTERLRELEGEVRDLEAAQKSIDEVRVQREPSNTESYDAIKDNDFLAVRDHALSTFSIDVDTASYANVRRFLNEQHLPPKGAVRIEELINYFDYDYPQPDGEAPFSASMEVAACPWTPDHRLVRIGLKGREIQADKRPATNLVFLVDVSGSMQPENKLPLVKKSLRQLVDKLGGEDTVAIAVYAGASGCVLEPTNKKSEMRAALDRLESGGSTNGAAGIQLAYQLAERSFIKGGVNRVILATDGDFNVGVTNQSDLIDLIEKKAKSGVFLTVLGFGMGNLKDSTLEKLADKGNGNYAYIDTFNEARKVLVEQMSGTLVTIAKDVKIQVEFNPAQVSAYRLIGYENRMLKKEDFNDDTKDAGEIGAGHTVTALYEVVPTGTKAPGAPGVDPLKYQPTPTDETKRYLPTGVDPTVASRELLTLKLRYKAPDGDTSKLLEFPLTDDGKSYERSSRDFRFASAVASFGMLLRDSPHKGKANWSSTLELALEGKGEDRSGYRAEFVSLIERAKAASR